MSRRKRRGFSGLGSRKGSSTMGWLIGAVAVLVFWKGGDVVDQLRGKVRNRSKADGIHPDLQAALDEWDTDGPFPITIGSGVRTDAEQLALWWMGRDAEGNVIDESKHATNAKDTSQTSHGIRSGYGNAFDFDPVSNGLADYQQKQAIAGAWFMDRGFVWGGAGADWLKAFPPSAANPLGGDRRHVNIKGWQNIPI